MQTSTINDLPDEILEYILSFLPPYEDLDKCTVVCKRWHKNVQNMIRHTRIKFYRGINNFDIKWTSLSPSSHELTITKRYSHSACYHDYALYVFGGCTCTSTTFNDLWRLNLSTRRWDRLLTLGTYPSPKAYATLVQYKESMILFGGWTHPLPYPLHQAWKTYNELHIYETLENRWTAINSLSSPPAMAGHSATVHGKTMIVFGGLHERNGSSNDVWCFDLENFTWTKQATSEEKPARRYGQSQIYIDDHYVMIIGGCKENPLQVLDDVWLLEMTDPVWQWHRIEVKNNQWSAPHIWCNPASRVGDYVVVLSCNPKTTPEFSYHKWVPTSQCHQSAERLRLDLDDVPNSIRRASESVVIPKPIDRDINVNGRRGSLSRNINLGASTSGTQSFSSRNSGASTSGMQSFSSKYSGSSTSGILPSSSRSSSGTSSSRSSSGTSSSKPNSNSYPTSRNSPASRERIPRIPDFSNQSSNAMAAFRDVSSSQPTTRQREKQLEALKRMEERIQKIKNSKLKASNSARASEPGPSKMAMFVLDISTILTHGFVTWLPIKSVPNGSPVNTILYSLTLGNGELIMFGGIQKDPASITQIQNTTGQAPVTNSVSNSLHFISAIRGII